MINAYVLSVNLQNVHKSVQSCPIFSNYIIYYKIRLKTGIPEYNPIEIDPSENIMDVNVT